MTTTPAALEAAARHHQAGDLRQAEQLYQQVLQQDPHHAVALYLLGMLARQTGRNELAIDLTTRALRLKPDYVEAHNSLGNALAAQGRPVEAAANYQEAIRLKPDFALAHNNLGNVLETQGRRDEAVACYQRALRLQPDFAEASSNLGIALQERGKLREAMACYRQALRLRPESAEYRETHDRLRAWLAAQGRLEEADAGSLEEALSAGPDSAAGHLTVGNLFLQQRRLDEAAACYYRALRLQPDWAEAHTNLGIVLNRQGKPAEAVATLQWALHLKPDLAEAHDHLGIALAEQGKLDEAIASHREAVRLKPDYVTAHNNLGAALFRRGDLEEALASYERALHFNPDAAVARLNRALIWLLQGNFTQGWPEYEWRFHTRGNRRRTFRQPLWDGSPLAGRTILLHAEQGLGDTLHFVRYAAVLQRQGARVVVECPGPLTRILGSCPGIDQLVARGSALPAFDCHAPLLSLPGILGTTLETIPADVPYLAADEGLVARWREKLSGIGDFKIGIAWQGNRDYPQDRYRSAPLAHFACLARLPGVRLVSLQKGAGTEQLAAADFPVTDLGRELDETSGPFMDTAAVMKNLDLVITVDLALAHLAGALAVPVWVALALVPHWCWLSHRSDSPWYPTARLFRQTELESWQPVFDRMAAAVRELIEGRGR